MVARGKKMAGAIGKISPCVDKQTNTPRWQTTVGGTKHKVTVNQSDYPEWHHAQAPLCAKSWDRYLQQVAEDNKTSGITLPLPEPYKATLPIVSIRPCTFTLMNVLHRGLYEVEWSPLIVYALTEETYQLQEGECNLLNWLHARAELANQATVACIVYSTKERA